MDCHCLTKSALRELADIAEAAERIAHALEGVARFADQTNRGEIGGNLSVLADVLQAKAERIDDIVQEHRHSPVSFHLAGRDGTNA